MCFGASYDRDSKYVSRKGAKSQRLICNSLRALRLCVRIEDKQGHSILVRYPLKVCAVPYALFGFGMEMIAKSNQPKPTTDQDEFI